MQCRIFWYERFCVLCFEIFTPSLSPLECKFQTKSGKEPFMPEYPALVYACSTQFNKNVNTIFHQFASPRLISTFCESSVVLRVHQIAIAWWFGPSTFQWLFQVASHFCPHSNPTKSSCFLLLPLQTLHRIAKGQLPFQPLGQERL